MLIAGKGQQLPITRYLLTDLAVTDADADRYLPDLVKLMPQYEIDNRSRITQFLAQILHESGHITLVAPESELMSAARNAAGEVPRPVESQAGRQNHRLVVKPSKWWLAGGFRNCTFWRHG